MNGLPEPWGSLLTLLTGPYGVVVLEGVVIYFLYKLYREALTTGQKAQDNVALLTATTKELVESVSEYRKSQGTFFEGFDRFTEKWQQRGESWLATAVEVRTALAEISRYMREGK